MCGPLWYNSIVNNINKKFCYIWVAFWLFWRILKSIHLITIYFQVCKILWIKIFIKDDLKSYLVQFFSNNNQTRLQNDEVAGKLPEDHWPTWKIWIWYKFIPFRKKGLFHTVILKSFFAKPTMKIQQR